MSVSGPARLISNAPFSRSPISRVGEYDHELICLACEKYFATLDGYAHRLLFLDTPKTFFDQNVPILDVHVGYEK